MKKHFSHIGCIFLLLTVLSGCVGNRHLVYLQDKTQNRPHKSFEESVHANPPVVDTIRPGDYLHVKIHRLIIGEELIGVTSIEQGVTGQVSHPYRYSYLVDEKGEIMLPVLGKIRVSGLSLWDAKEKIEGIAAINMPEAAVEVLLLNHHVSVLGEVATPGRIYLYDERVSVLDVIAMSGGLREFADREHVKIVREVPSGELVFHLDLTDRELLESEQYYARHGDLIIISPLPRRKFANRAQVLISGLTALIAFTSLLITASSTLN